MVFDRARVDKPVLSVAHYRDMAERTIGPVLRLHEALRTTDPPKLAARRRELEALAAEYFEGNCVRQDYLLTRAIKV